MKLELTPEEFDAILHCVQYTHTNEYTHYQESFAEEREFHIYEKAVTAYAVLRRKLEM